jgi:ribosomal subunit interface protein
MNRIEVRGKNIEVTQALREYAEKRIEKILDQFEQEGKAVVKLSVEKEQKIVEATLMVEKITLRSEERNSDMYLGIDTAADKLERQIRKHKTRLSKRIRLRQIEVEQSRNAKETPTVEDLFEVARTKRVLLTPMNQEEAILQMNLLQHDFFAFLDVEADGINVVYRRKDGRYGLLELER